MKRRYRIARWLGHQFWLRGRGRLLLSLCPPDMDTGEEFQVDFFGMNYRGFLDDFIDRHVYIYGGYELNILALLSQLAKLKRSTSEGPLTYVDIGANVGQHAIFMSPYADHVICFEPYEPVRKRLEERILVNHLNNVCVQPVALASKSGTFFYYPPTGHNQGTGSLVPEMCSDHPAAPIEVQTEIGDRYFAGNSARPPSIIKIDVEGSELAVLAGLKQTLKRCRPVVILELSEFTRAKVGSLSKLREFLYPDAVIFTIGQNPGRVDYTLSECDFQEPNNILVLPSEFSTIVPRRESFASVPEFFPGISKVRMRVDDSSHMTGQSSDRTI